MGKGCASSVLYVLGLIQSIMSYSQYCNVSVPIYLFFLKQQTALLLKSSY